MSRKLESITIEVEFVPHTPIVTSVYIHVNYEMQLTTRT